MQAEPCFSAWALTWCRYMQWNREHGCSCLFCSLLIWSWSSSWLILTFYKSDTSRNIGHAVWLSFRFNFKKILKKLLFFRLENTIKRNKKSRFGLMECNLSHNRWGLLLVTKASYIYYFWSSNLKCNFGPYWKVWCAGFGPWAISWSPLY